jgi:hypothetical protein
VIQRRVPTLERHGTRFRLFAQDPALEAFREPETVWISRAPGTVAAGPADERMYVVDAIGKPGPYDYPYLPPYRGPAGPPALPGRDGHFDDLAVGSPEFRAAHMYGTVRRVLDIWEGYAGRRIEWHFRGAYDRLELVPYVEWENAQAGFGFIETGYARDERGEPRLHWQNFAVLAHELGHLLIYSEVGTPPRATRTEQYFGFHESAADLVALVACLHFHTVADHVLRRSAGNLYYLTELSRIGELSETTQLRIADNDLRMSDVEDLTASRDLNCALHQLAQPLTGAVFDIFVDVYQQNLVDAGLISEELDHASGRVSGVLVDDPAVEAAFAAAYEGRHEAFKAVLMQTRDYLGTGLAHAWCQLSPNHLSYVDVHDALQSVDHGLTGGRYAQTIRESFAWREIGSRSTTPRSTSLPGARRGIVGGPLSRQSGSRPGRSRA